MNYLRSTNQPEPKQVKIDHTPFKQIDDATIADQLAYSTSEYGFSYYGTKSVGERLAEKRMSYFTKQNIAQVERLNVFDAKQSIANNQLKITTTAIDNNNLTGDKTISYELSLIASVRNSSQLGSYYYTKDSNALDANTLYDYTQMAEDQGIMPGHPYGYNRITGMAPLDQPSTLKFFTGAVVNVLVSKDIITISICHDRRPHKQTIVFEDIHNPFEFVKTEDFEKVIMFLTHFRMIDILEYKIKTRMFQSTFYVAEGFIFHGIGNKFAEDLLTTETT